MIVLSSLQAFIMLIQLLKSLSSYLIFIILLQNRMISPKQVKSRSTFYRGISLKQYLRKAPESSRHQQYKDEETIFLDDNKQPVIIGDSFINIQTQEDNRIPRSWRGNQDQKREFCIINRKFHLPSILSKNQTKTKSNSLNTDRRSTEDSFVGDVESKISKLPNLKELSIVRQRNITMASRNSSRSTCCRKKVTKVIHEVVKREEQPSCHIQKLQSKTENAQQIRKENNLRKRYGLRGGPKYQEENIKYFNNANSKKQ